MCAWQANAQAQHALREATAWLPSAGPVQELALAELEAAEAEAMVEQLSQLAAHAENEAPSSVPGVVPAAPSGGGGGGWGSARARQVLALDRISSVVRSLREASAELEQQVRTTEQRLERAQDLHLGLAQVAEGLAQRQLFLARKQAPPPDPRTQRACVSCPFPALVIVRPLAESDSCFSSRLPSHIKKLIASTEHENGVLLQGIVTVTTIMFAKNEHRMRVQMQSLLEVRLLQLSSMHWRAADTDLLDRRS